MTDIALALPAALDEEYAFELARHGHRQLSRCGSADELVADLGGGGIEVALVAATSGFLDERLLAESDRLGVRVIGLALDAGERRYAASVGLLDVVDRGDGWPGVERMLTRAAMSPVSRGTPDRGRVIAVWGPVGSPGRTSTAIGIAAELAAAGHAVALADVDTHGGSIAPSLGLLDEAPGFAAACRLAGAGALDTTQLERIGQRYLSGHGSFWVLTGIGRPTRWPELSTDRVEATLRACRRWVDYVVVDTGASLEHDEEISSDLLAPRRNAATIAALREADHVVAVGAADPIGLSRFLRAHPDLRETALADEVSIVITRVRPGAVGADPAAQITQTLRRFGGLDPAALVPHDLAGYDAALLTGRTMLDTAPRSAARQALARFVRARLLPAPEPVRSRRERRERRRGLRAATS